LLIPIFGSLGLISYQIFRYINYKDLDHALDSEGNPLYGLLITIWATLFIESWKRK